VSRGIIPRGTPWKKVVSSERYWRQGYRLMLECGHIVYRLTGTTRPAPMKCKCETCGCGRLTTTQPTEGRAPKEPSSGDES
jgi:hypothetical protein